MIELLPFLGLEGLADELVGHVLTRSHDATGSRLVGDPELGSFSPRGSYQTAGRGNIMSWLFFRSARRLRSGRWKRARVRVNTQKANSEPAERRRPRDVVRGEARRR